MFLIALHKIAPQNTSFNTREMQQHINGLWVILKSILLEYILIGLQTANE